MTAATNLAGLGLSGSIQYYTGGEGEPLLLLHGLAGASGNWVELLPDLLQRHRVIAVDLPGHAGSGPPPRGTRQPTSRPSRRRCSRWRWRGPPSSPATPSVGSSRCGSRERARARARPAARLAGRNQDDDAAARSLVLASTTVRPGRWVAPLRHRYAGRAWYRRAVFRPWFVSDATSAPTPRATHGLLDAQREHTDTKTAARAMCADDPRRDLAESRARSSSSGAHATRSCRSTTPSSTHAGSAPSFGSSPTAATS